MADPDDDLQRMLLRKSEATARGGDAYQRLLQLAETRDSGQIPPHREVHRRHLQRRG